MSSPSDVAAGWLGRRAGLAPPCRVIECQIIVETATDTTTGAAANTVRRTMANIPVELYSDALPNWPFMALISEIFLVNCIMSDGESHKIFRRLASAAVSTYAFCLRRPFSTGVSLVASTALLRWIDPPSVPVTIAMSIMHCGALANAVGEMALAGCNPVAVACILPNHNANHAAEHMARVAVAGATAATVLGMAALWPGASAVSAALICWRVLRATSEAELNAAASLRRRGRWLVPAAYIALSIVFIAGVCETAHWVTGPGSVMRAAASAISVATNVAMAAAAGWGIWSCMTAAARLRSRIATAERDLPDEGMDPDVVARDAVLGWVAAVGPVGQQQLVPVLDGEARASELWRLR